MSDNVNIEQPTGVTGQHDGQPSACGTSSAIKADQESSAADSAHQERQGKSGPDSLLQAPM